MRFLVPVLVVVLGAAGPAAADPPRETPPPAGKDQAAPPGVAGSTALPPGLAKKFGDEAPEEAWIAFHPTRDDGAWLLVDFEWTLVTGFPAALRAEVREARTRKASPPPVRLPDVGVALHVVRFGPPR
jgi:hypothetical protein